MFSKIGWRSKDESSASTSKKHVKSVQIDGRDAIWSVAFFDDSKYIVSGGKEGRIRRWRVEDGTEVGSPMDARTIICGIAVSSDGKWIVSGTGHRRVTVWNAENYSKTREFHGHTSYVYAVDVSPDATRIATGSRDGTICVWSLPRGEQLLGPLPLASHVVAVKFSPDGRLIASATWGPHTIRIRDSQDSSHPVDVPIHVGSSFSQSIAWAHDSKQLFVLSSAGNIHCLDASTGTTLRKWHTRNSTSDAKCIALANNGMFIAASAGSSVAFWDTTTRKRIGSVIRHPADIECIAISKNYDIVIGGDEKITLRNLCDVIPSSYYQDMLRDQEMQCTKVEITKLEESLRSQEQSSSDKIAHLEKTIQEQRNELVESRHAAEQKVDTLNETIKTFVTKDEGSSRKIAHLEQTVEGLRMQLADSQRKVDKKDGTIRTLNTFLRAYDEQHRCEALYAAGRIYDVAELLMEIGDIGHNEARANMRIVDWVNEFTHRCATSLESIGDEAFRTKQIDEALRAYSMALSLGSSNPKALLTKWASATLVRGSPNEALGAAAKFKLPRFLIHQAICDVLERDGNVAEAIECLQQMKRELAGDKGIVPTEQATWEFDFRARCVGRLEKLGDAAMDSENPDETIRYYSHALSLGPVDCSRILVKRSTAQAAMGSWEEALVDADKVIELDPSCYKGYERKHAALHGMGRHSEAFRAFRVMLTKLEQSSDPHIADVRHQFVDPTPTIRKVIQQTIRILPRVLIDTATGRLYDKTQQAAAFEELSIFHEIRSSMTTRLDRERISREVKKYYRYVMLSHRWEDGEPLYQTVGDISVYDLEKSPANIKLQTFCSLMGSLGFQWVWSDTCCINKKDNVVLQESLVAMFTWYHGSSLTIVYLRGVLSRSQHPGDLQRSSWNTRAWTYQEYVAAKNVQFYTEDWKPYLGLDMFNHKDSPAIISEMEQVSGVSALELAVLRPGLDKVREKLFLASTRQTTLVEDAAYSLLGIFDAAIPVIYGEGTSAVGRLLEHILTGSRDVTILAWTGSAGRYNSCLPLDLTVYDEIVPPHISRLIEAGDMEHTIMELRSSSPNLSLVVTLHDRLHEIPSPFMSARRLYLPGIVFPITELVRTSESVYRATTSMLGDVEVKTRDNLTEMSGLCLVHPWIRPLLDQEFLDGAAGLDMTTKALRLVARLKQPFGALLFAPETRIEYKRVAADSLIMAQVCEGASLSELTDGIRTIEVQ